MVINGLDLPCIGFMRAKPLGDGEHYTLAIYPPGPGPLAGAEPATMIELEVSTAELRRIDGLASHLIAKPVVDMTRNWS